MLSHVAETAAPAARPPPAPAAHDLTFREFLSELNPLQYIPVVGAIYRAVTGDTIPESVRTAGSLVVSGLTGGPIGVAVNVAAMAVEKAIGIDPEKIESDVLADIGIGHHAPTPAQLKAYQPTPADALNELELARIKSA